MRIKSLLIVLCLFTGFNFAFAKEGWINILNEGGNNKGILCTKAIQKAIDAVANGETPVGLADPDVATQRFGPDTVDGIAPAAQWQQWWQDAAAKKRKGAPWNVQQ